MIPYAPTPAARLELLREQFDRLFALIGDRLDHLAACPGDDGRDEERAVVETLARLARMVEQADHEVDPAAAYTLATCVAIVQGELPVKLHALAAATRDTRAASIAREWADDLAALAESEAA